MKLEQLEDVAVFRMNNGKANAIGPAWLDETNRLLDAFATTQPGALVLTGYDRFFSAGLDIPALIPLSHDEMERFITRFNLTMMRLFELPFPVVAAVNGHAIAGGCVVAVQADYRVMARGPVTVGLNEVALGIGLPAAVLETLRAQVPAASLGPIALEGKLFSADEAVALGLVHEALDAGAVEARAVAKARELGALPRDAFAHVKQHLRAPTVERVAAAKDDARRWVETWMSDEAQRTLKAAVARIKR